MTPFGIWNVLLSAVRDGSEAIAGTRCLVLAPHPDDEVLGCGGTLASKAQHNDEVFVVYLTNGRLGALSSSEDTCERRQREALQAAAILGIPADRLIFLQFEDGHLTDWIVQAIEQVQQIIDKRHIDTIFLPYRREYHRDHLAAWRIGLACRRNRLQMYEYPIWYGPWLWRRLGWRARMAAASHLTDTIRAVKVNIASTLELKRQALNAYQSQLQAFERERWGSAFLKHFLGDYELFFVSR